MNAVVTAPNRCADRDLAIFRDNLNGEATLTPIKVYGVRNRHTTYVIRRRLASLTQRELHVQLTDAGCSLDCIVTQCTPEYVELLRRSRQLLSAEQIEVIWFGTPLEHVDIW